MKKILLYSAALIFFYSSGIFAQSSADSAYNAKINFIETKIAKIKSLPKEEQKQYYAVLSDAENRKNTLKSLLKTPVEKRDKVWQQSWDQNYLKAVGKLENIQTK